MKAPLIAISRHRLSVDGEGVTTLVAFHGCPLRCRYCLNSQCWSDDGIWRWTTPEELTDELMCDNLYFLATGGGVCFGGGEPLLHADFIAQFARLRPQQWNLYLETSLHVPTEQLARVAPYVKHYYIDVKDLQPDVYHRYTGGDVNLLMKNLRWMAKERMQQRVTLRLPLIAHYNTDAQRHHSQQLLTDLGFSHFDRFEYTLKNNRY